MWSMRWGRGYQTPCKGAIAASMQHAGIAGAYAAETLMKSEQFPLDLRTLRPLELDPTANALTTDQRATLNHHNIQLAETQLYFSPSSRAA